MKWTLGISLIIVLLTVSCSIPKPETPQVVEACNPPSFPNKSTLSHAQREYPCYYLIREGQECANLQRKPHLVFFDCLGCTGSRRWYQLTWMNDSLQSYIQNHYVITWLQIDNKKLILDPHDWVINVKGNTLKSWGEVNDNYLITEIGRYCPLWAIYDNEGKLIKTVHFGEYEKLLHTLKETVNNFNTVE